MKTVGFAPTRVVTTTFTEWRRRLLGHVFTERKSAIDLIFIRNLFQLYQNFKFKIVSMRG
jgi:hypothetical protein